MLESYETSGHAPEGSVCETYLGLANQTGISCHWEFMFRSDDATSFYDDIWAEVTYCRNGREASISNPVNHPDSYLQRELFSETGTYRVAVKDKGHTKRTLIFSSFENRN